jgi:hypothetical protein
MNHIEFDSALSAWLQNCGSMLELEAISGYSLYEIRRAKDGSFNSAIPDLIESMQRVKRPVNKERKPRVPVQTARKTAVQLGFSKYEGGVCKVCGNTERYTSSCACVRCLSDRYQTTKLSKCGKRSGAGQKSRQGSTNAT